MIGMLLFAEIESATLFALGRFGGKMAVWPP
jgi:hypothetical protein